VPVLQNLKRNMGNKGYLKTTCVNCTDT